MTPFEQQSIRDAVAAAIAKADIPAGHTSALAVVATTQGVSGALAWKVGDHWQVDAVFSAHDQHVEGGIAVQASW